MQTGVNGADKQYTEFRKSALSKKDEAQGIALSGSEPYKVLVEFYLSGAPVAVFCAIDGTAAIYFGSGSGFFENVQNETMQKIAKSIVFEAKNIVMNLEEKYEFPHAQEGEINVYVVTEDKVLGTFVDQSMTFEQQTDIWKIYYLASELVSMRMNS